MAIDLKNITQELRIYSIHDHAPDNTDAKYTMQPKPGLANEVICELVQAVTTYIILLDNDTDKANAYIQIAQEYCTKIDKDEYIYRDLQDAKHDLKINMERVWKEANGVTPIKKKA